MEFTSQLSGLSSIDGLNFFCLAWFLLCWIIYSQFAKVMAKRTHSLSSVLHLCRIEWMERLMARENRVSDASLIANLERNVTFSASTSLLIVAGIVTVMTASDTAFTVLEHLPLAVGTSVVELQFKLLVMIGVFIYAFFTFTWSMRQYGFGSILVGAAPMVEDAHVSDEQRKVYALQTAKVLDQAAHSFNYGLRAFYFAMSLLAWFVSPWVFLVAVTLVVVVLYRREFCSKPLQSMIKIKFEG